MCTEYVGCDNTFRRMAPVKDRLEDAKKELSMCNRLFEEDGE
jgi:hypothetical protein